MHDFPVSKSSNQTLPNSRIDVNLKRSIPNAITFLRLIALPHLIYSFNHEIMFAVYALFFCSIGSDLVDGYIARKIGSTSNLGAKLDVTVDFLFINGMFLTFIHKAIYPSWILVLIIVMFAQFTLTNHYSKKTIYDPIGKYYGSVLFAGIGLTLLFPTQTTYNIVIIIILISTAAAIISRSAYFAKTRLSKIKTANNR